MLTMQLSVMLWSQVARCLGINLKDLGKLFAARFDSSFPDTLNKAMYSFCPRMQVLVHGGNKHSHHTLAEPIRLIQECLGYLCNT